MFWYLDNIEIKFFILLIVFLLVCGGEIKDKKFIFNFFFIRLNVVIGLLILFDIKCNVELLILIGRLFNVL